ncbi:MAG: hypothetical protein WCK75_06115 [Elusimicrobiota bacterium]
MEKKNSLFAGLSSAPASPFSPASASAPKPAASDQDITALKQKMEALEGTIAAVLEKKIGEALKGSVPAAPRPPDMNAQFLLTRIGELDKRLEEFARSAMVSSSQIKNIEESKISARREIEDLLKVVREQQKYSELDRQMHDQLEKSWRRVEELEKKLMDFYGSILTGQQKKEDIDGMLSRDLGGRIEALAARLELHTQAVEAKLLAQNASLAVVADIKKEVMAELTRTREETLALGKEQAAALRAMFEELMPGSVTAELERSRRDASEEIGLFKKEFSGYMADMRVMLDNFNRAARENLVRAEGVQESVAKNTADTAALLKGNFEKISETLDREGGKFLSELEQRNKRHFEALNTKYADALSNAAVLDFIGSSADVSLKKMAALEETLSGLINEVDKDRLSAALGVSGMLVRKNFEAMEALLAGIRQDASGLERIKNETGDKLKGFFREGSK